MGQPNIYCPPNLWLRWPREHFAIHGSRTADIMQTEGVAGVQAAQSLDEPAHCGLRAKQNHVVKSTPLERVATTRTG